MYVMLYLQLIIKCILLKYFSYDFKKYISSILRYQQSKEIVLK